MIKTGNVMAKYGSKFLGHTGQTFAGLPDNDEINYLSFILFIDYFHNL